MRISMGKVLAALACVALVGPGAAEAAKKTYEGPIKPSGGITFTVKKSKSGKKKIVILEFAQLPVSCTDGRKTTSGTLDFKIPLKKGKFEVVATRGPNRNPTARAAISGRIEGRSASGKIEVRGSKIPIDGGTSGNCESGKRSWTASR